MTSILDVKDSPELWAIELRPFPDNDAIDVVAVTQSGRELGASRAANIHSAIMMTSTLPLTFADFVSLDSDILQARVIGR